MPEVTAGAEIGAQAVCLESVPLVSAHSGPGLDSGGGGV